MKTPTIDHMDVSDLFKKMKVTPKGDMHGEDLVFIVRPGIRITDTAKLLLERRGIEIKRDTAAPIDSAYLLDRATYAKYNATFRKKV